MVAWWRVRTGHTLARRDARPPLVPTAQAATWALILSAVLLFNAARAAFRVMETTFPFVLSAVQTACAVAALLDLPCRGAERCVGYSMAVGGGVQVAFLCARSVSTLEGRGGEGGGPDV